MSALCAVLAPACEVTHELTSNDGCEQAKKDFSCSDTLNRTDKLQTRCSVQQTEVRALQCHTYLAQALQSTVHVAGVA
jgi:hypothetical protein